MTERTKTKNGKVFLVGLFTGFIATWFYLILLKNRNNQDIEFNNNEGFMPFGMSDEPEKSTGSYTGG